MGFQPVASAIPVQCSANWAAMRGSKPTEDKLNTSLTANIIIAKLTTLIIPLTDKHYSLESEDYLPSGFRKTLTNNSSFLN